MSEVSRRAFLKQSGATAAAAGAFVAIPKGLASKPRTQAPRSARTASAPAAKRTNEKKLVVHVPDTSASAVHIFVGSREVVVHDRDLVARLTRATH